MMITDSGIIIRTPASDISLYSRTAAGVIVMRLEKGQKLVNITKTAKEEEDEQGESVENGAEAVDTVVTAEAESAPVEE